uniref:N-terminal acetyltransferase B complex subunit MDM20 homolog n=1 Tax=Onchocerca volvulus TaxID=6282 RepID=A0A8R1Y381_ONCVO
MSKSSDQIVLERRLKPIYDAIDAGSNKKAMQEAEKVLKKHPTTHCAKVLKALALIRADRVSEAWPLINEVESVRDDFDENTLQALCHCFKEAYAPERISTLYEKICARYPKNEQYLTHLFMSYVRIRNYKQQQKTALALYKEFQRNPYYFWNVMSIVMQAITGDQKLAQSTLYPLAEKMVTKMIESNLIQAEAEYDLYVLILENSRQYAKAALFLEADGLARRHIKYPAQFLFYNILRLYQLEGDHETVIERSISELKNNPDDWSLWTFLFDSTFAFIKNAEEEGAKKRLLDRVVERILSLITEPLNKILLRGPYLARLTLIRKLLENEIVASNLLDTLKLSDPHDYVFEYIRLFHDKPCCYIDLKPFLFLIRDDQVDNFMQRVSDFIDMLRKEYNQEEGKITNVHWADVVYQRLRRGLGLHEKLSAVEKRRAVTYMVKMIDYCSDSDLAAAVYAHLAANLLWDLYVDNGDADALYELILLLEWVVKNHPSDPVSAIILCKAYSSIGVTTQVQRFMRALDIKYIQRDTLGYFVYGLLEQYGRFSSAIIHYTELAAFFDQTEREVSECLTTAYKNGSFLQIPRLVEFLNRINKSFTAVGVDIQTRALSACFALDKIQLIVDTMYGDEELIDFLGLVDNRDFGIIPSLNANKEEQKLNEMKKRTYHEQCDAMKLSHLLMKSIAAIGHSKCTLRNLSIFLDELKKHVEYCRQTYTDNETLPNLLQSPPSLHLRELINTPKMDLLMLLLKSASSVVECSENIISSNIIEQVHEEKLLHCLPDVTEIERLIIAVVASNVATGALCFHLTLRHCSMVLQVLSFAQLIVKLLEMVVDNIFAFSFSLGVRKGNFSKNQRKNVVLNRLYAVRTMIIKGVTSINTHLSDVYELLKSDDLIPEISNDYDEAVYIILLKEQAQVDSSIIASYADSITDMQKTIKHMLNQLQA